MSMYKELKQADHNAKLIALTQYVENLLKAIEKRVDKLEEDENVNYDSSDLQYLKGSADTMEIIKDFVNNLW